MADMPDGKKQETEGAYPAPVEAMPTEAKAPPENGRPEDDAHKDDQPKNDAPPDKPEHPPDKKDDSKPRHPRRKWLIIGGIGLVAVGVGLYFLIPFLITYFNTVSTDDAYINGHVTLVAPRVAGQVTRVLVEDNYHVKKGDVLVELDREPYLVQVHIREAAMNTSKADLYAAQAQVRGFLALARSQRWRLQNEMELVATQVANLKANIAVYVSKLATLNLARANLKRGEELQASGGISKEQLDERRQTVKVDEADADQALQLVHANRVGLGLDPGGSDPKVLAIVPSNIDQNFSTVRTSLATLLQTTSQIGLPLPSVEAPPKQVLDEFTKQDVSGNIDKIIEKLIPQSPQVKQAEAKLQQAKQDLEQALLNLKYCQIVSDIDGIVTRRNVNPGNNVQVGQSLMAVRSITEIWVDANFKETQLSNLRIGQKVWCDVDMYGKHKEFEGRITGFTMGTGQTLSLLPAENATGNFVKIVQRLPVRIEFTNYDPKKDPLFVGLSVTPYVYYKEAPTGPNAGEVLQPLAPLPQGATNPVP